MAASPEFFQPAATPDLTPRLFVVATAAQDDDDAYYLCRTPTGAQISYLRNPATCPPAPIKPRPPSACRKRLFAASADIAALNFDDLEAVFRPASLPDGKPEQQQRRRNSNKPRSARRSVGALAN